jgi:hypothetical protein
VDERVRLQDGLEVGQRALGPRQRRDRDRVAREQLAQRRLGPLLRGAGGGADPPLGVAALGGEVVDEAQVAIGDVDAPPLEQRGRLRDHDHRRPAGVDGEAHRGAHARSLTCGSPLVSLGLDLLEEPAVPSTGRARRASCR